MPYREAIENMKIEKIRAADMINLISIIGQYPELPLYITRPGVKQALEIPFNERKNLMFFVLAAWEYEAKRIEYMLNKLIEQQKGAGCEG